MKKLLLSGYGDTARRAAPRLEARYEVRPLSRRPPDTGTQEPRTRHLLAALAKGRILPARVVYVSTSGVYGDRGGARVDDAYTNHVHAEDLAAIVVFEGVPRSMGAA